MSLREINTEKGASIYLLGSALDKVCRSKIKGSKHSAIEQINIE